MYTSVIVDEFNNEVPFTINVKKYNQMLNQNTNMLFRRRDKDVWDSSDQFPLEFNTIKGNYSNTIMQNFDLNINKKYNFTITNCSNDLKLYKKEF